MIDAPVAVRGEWRAAPATEGPKTAQDERARDQGLQARSWLHVAGWWREPVIVTKKSSCCRNAATVECRIGKRVARRSGNVPHLRLDGLVCALQCWRSC